jgi:hypothetical protein
MSESTLGSEHPAGDSLAAAAQAVRDGAADAQRHAEEMIPVVTDFLCRLAYSTSYAVSYGAVFSTLFVIQAVPKDNVFVQGLVDGAQAARDAVRGVRA